MSRSLKAVLSFCLLACLAASRSAVAAPEVRKISIVPAGHEGLLRDAGFEVWTRQADFILGSAGDATIDKLASRGIVPVAVYDDTNQWMYLLHHRPGFVAPVAAGATIYALTPEIDLYLFPSTGRVDLPPVKPYAAFQGVPRIPLPPLATHPADLQAMSSPLPPQAPNPLVQQIVNATNQANWFQFVRDMSGDNPVTIGGQTWTISTRYADAMFPTPLANAHATEYLEDRGAAFGYTSHRENYTSADSGCGNQGKTWQNLIFIVPGQVDYGKHQQVLFVNHYDTISYSVSQSNTLAPGADDAISGGGAVFEAMRIFKDYAFKNTIVFAWFSGEEEGICGSGAYVRQHPSIDMWRAVNMDQTAFDGNGDRIMNVYNWDTTNSPASVALGDTFVQANSDYGNIIAPAKIVRDTTKMCQTDHCPFWDVGVGAIAVLEDLHDNDICPCFDQTQTATCHDSVTQIYNSQLMFTQAYSWPTEKAAVAVVAQIAEPLYACPAAPVNAPVATPENNAVALSWNAATGVTNYVVERAATCAGPFDGIGSVTGTTFEDTTAVNGSSYAYRVRTCPTQVSACTTAGPAASPSVKYQDGSATIVADSGDHDGIADDCELVTVRVNLINDGNVPLHNVRLASVTSSSPAVRVASAVPEVIPGALGVGATTQASFKIYVGRDGTSAACGDTLPFTIAASSDEAPAATRAFTLTAERSITNGPLTYGFETDLSGWSVVAGAVNLATDATPGAPGSVQNYLQFRASLNNDCDAVQSPVIKPSAGSTMSAWVDYQIESGFDRANIRAVDAKTGEKFLLTPTGAVYNTSNNTNLLCDNMGNLSGWSQTFQSWRQANFDLSPYAGREIKLEARYSTDQSVLGAQGFWMDFVQVANAQQLDCDAQSQVCAALPPEVSPNGSPVPFTMAKVGTDFELDFSESTGASSYNVYAGSLANLALGIYDHAQLPGLCGFTDPTPGDGTVAVTVAGGSIPDNSYLLVAARTTVGESPYGHNGTGGEIPLALNACP